MVRLLRPTADIEVDGWTRDDGSSTNLYQAIDEASASEADYIRSTGAQNPAAYTASFTGGSETGTNSGVTIRVREMKDSAAAETTDLDVIARTASGWDIHTENYDDIDDSINAVEFTLSTDEMAEFRAHGGDFADMRVRLVRRKRTANTTTSSITYSGSLLADLYRPTTGGPFATVIIIHDGGWNNSDRLYPAVVTAATRLSTEEGFAVLCIQVHEAPASNSPVPQDDCAAAVAWIVANAATYNLDATKIGAYGGSGGGHMAAYLGTKVRLSAGNKSRLLCAVSGSGPMDLMQLDTDGSEQPPAYDYAVDLIGVVEAGHTAEWQAASPLYQISVDCAPIFLANSASERIAATQATRMRDALTAAGIDTRTVIPPGTDHGFACLARTDVWPEAVTWLHRYLG